MEIKLKKIYYTFLRGYRTVISIPREIKYFIQRGRRGWSDCDAWGLYYYLIEIVPPMLRRMKEGPGYPADFYNENDTDEEGFAKWNETLEKMAVGFESGGRLSECDFYDEIPLKEGEINKVCGIMNVDYKLVKNEERLKKLEKEYEEGIELFRKYFLNLWD